MHQIPSFGLDARSDHSRSKHNLTKANSYSMFTTLKEKAHINQYPVSHKMHPISPKNGNGL
jgi:hypothetical protein